MASAGWHPSPDDQNLAHYWDGAQWTDERRWNGAEWVTQRVVAATPPLMAGVPRAQEASRRRGAGIAVLGGLTVAVGSLLPWLSPTVRADGLTIERNGLQLGKNFTFSPQGLITVVIGTLIVLIGLGALDAIRMPKWFARSPIVGGAIATAYGVYQAQRLWRHANAFTTSRVSESLGFGLYVLIAGGLVTLIGGALMLRRR